MVIVYYARACAEKIAFQDSDFFGLVFGTLKPVMALKMIVIYHCSHLLAVIFMGQAVSFAFTFSGVAVFFFHRHSYLLLTYGLL